MAERFRKVLKKYFDDVAAHISQARRNAEAYVKSGEVFEDRQANYEKQVKAQERLAWSRLASICELWAKVPEYGTDEDERRFYENLVDLKGKVPPILLEDGRRKKADGEEQVAMRTDAVSEYSDSAKAAAEAVEDQSMAIANKTIGAQVRCLVGPFTRAYKQDVIDQTAIDFAFSTPKPLAIDL
ncbi:mRNA decay protein [Metarhizium acridum]|nr:mRNA decay protein [Metarhizium acridum]